MAEHLPFEIYLDVDGVLLDFDSHAHDTGKYNESGKMDYESLDYEWYQGLPEYDGARDFHRDLSDIARVRFLTAPTMTPDYHRSRSEWVTEFLPKKGKFALLDLIICPARDKSLLAAPHRILVDDSEKNIKAWTEAGGIGIHHKGDYAETLAAVKQAMQDAQPGLGQGRRPGMQP